MAAITEAKLAITHDHKKKTANPKVNVTLAFTPLEVCLMKTCKGRWWKLKCQLWGSDSPDPDDFLYTYETVYYLPDADPTTTEKRTFDVVVGEGLLDEDGFPRPTDEIYGKVLLTNLTNGATLRRNTNIVEHRF